MEQELEQQLQNQLQARQPAQNKVNMPTIQFQEAADRIANGGGNPVGITESRKKADALVEEAFNQAIVSQVVNNQNVQSSLLSSATNVIKNKTDAIKSESETESKIAHFNNKKNACECFGYNETTTEKWAVNIMNSVHNVLTAIWIVIGTFTFAPITFVAKKVRVIFKAAWAAIIIALLVYATAVTSPFWCKWLASTVPEIWEAIGGKPTETGCQHSHIRDCICLDCGEEIHSVEEGTCICIYCHEEVHTLNGDCICDICGKDVHNYAEGYCTRCHGKEPEPVIIVDPVVEPEPEVTPEPEPTPSN